MKPHKLPALILCLAILLSLMSVSTMALEPIDFERDIRLSLSFQEGETPVVGAPFRLYLLATSDENGNMTATEQFSGYPVDLKNNDPDYWEVLATTLQGYILRDNLVPVDQGVTDETGIVTFPTTETKLVPGLYLILGEHFVQDGIAFTCDPLVHQLPMIRDNQWTYEMNIYTKHTSVPVEDEKPISRKVLKVWEDEGFEDFRPVSINVQLLCDGQIYDTVTLSEENNWRHTWEELEDGHVWSVVEADSKGYHVEITLQGITYVVINRPDTDIPTEPTDPTTPSDPTGPSEPTEPTDPTDPPDIPETGLLWWPVPLLIAGGLFLILCGFSFRKVRGPEDED